MIMNIELNIVNLINNYIKYIKKNSFLDNIKEINIWVRLNY